MATVKRAAPKAPSIPAYNPPSSGGQGDRGGRPMGGNYRPPGERREFPVYQGNSERAYNDQRAYNQRAYLAGQQFRQWAPQAAQTALSAATMPVRYMASNLYRLQQAPLSFAQGLFSGQAPYNPYTVKQIPGWQGVPSPILKPRTRTHR